MPKRFYLGVRKRKRMTSFSEALVVVPNMLLGFGAWVVMYTGLPAEPALILASLMVIDFVAGISKALATRQAISSRRMKAGVASKLGLLLIPLSCALAAKGIGGDITWIVAWVVNAMILSELYSIIANVHATRTGEILPEWDVVSMIGKKIRSFLEGEGWGR